MASIDLEDEALMEQDYLGDDDDLEMPPMVAPLSPLAESAETPGILDGLLGEPEPGEGEEKAKRLVKRKPQPKLDEVLLTGPRGIPSLEKHFERVKFRGKGCEVEDLGLLMSEMEHWLNRLYPKLTMREMITKLEKLGKKQQVKTCVSKIRLDMPILPEDFTGAADDDDNEDDVLRGDDEAIEPESEQAASQTQPQPSQPSLTDEQRDRMEQKRQLAMERRAAKKARMLEEEEDATPSGLSQEELDSMQTGGELGLAETEAKMIAEVEEMVGEMSGKVPSKGSNIGSQEAAPGKEPTSSTKTSLTEEEMAEMEREMFNS